MRFGVMGMSIRLNTAKLLISLNISGRSGRIEHAHIPCFKSAIYDNVTLLLVAFIYFYGGFLTYYPSLLACSRGMKTYSGDVYNEQVS